MNKEGLVKLTARAWSLGILARLSSGTPGRQAPLIAATGAPRNAFGPSLSQLIDIGLVERNPGHGHPLRPEFRLTEAGRAQGRVAAEVMRLTEGCDEAGRALLRRTWSLPVLALCREARGFSALSQALDPITDRALSQSLKALGAQGWISREVDAQARPPRPIYRAAGLGAEIASLFDVTAGAP